MRRLLVLASAVALTAVMLPVSPASAQPIGSIQAVVTGTTSGGPSCLPPGIDPETGDPCDTTEPVSGEFQDIVLAGLFSGVDTGGPDVATCLALVELNGSVSFTEPNNILLASGTLGSQGFTTVEGLVPPECSVSGTILGGSYDRIGAAAVASLQVEFSIWICLVRDPISGTCVVGEIHVENAQASVTAAVAAVPGAGEPLGDPASSRVAGVVVGPTL